MKKISLKIKTSDLLFANDKDRLEVFGNHVQVCFQLYLQQFGGSIVADLLKMNKILERVEEAEKGKKGTFQLEDDHYKLLKDAFDKVKWRGGIKVVIRLSENIDKAEDK